MLLIRCAEFDIAASGIPGCNGRPTPNSPGLTSHILATPPGWDGMDSQHVNKSAVLISWTNPRDGAATLFANGRARATRYLTVTGDLLTPPKCPRASTARCSAWLDEMLARSARRGLGCWAKNLLPRH